MKAVLDGVPLSEADARALWGRFSAWMEEHRGDLLGFAKAEGYASVHPEVHGAQPTLVLSRTTAQRAYTSAPKKSDTPDGPGPGKAGNAGKARRRRR